MKPQAAECYMQWLFYAEENLSQMPCNNGRELLSLMRFGAKEAVGFDISDVAIEEAKQLAKISGLNAKFERININGFSPENQNFDKLTSYFNKGP